MLLGKRITNAREARGWSRSDLARHAAVDPSYVTRIEEARYKRPSVDKVAQLAAALGIRLTELTDPVPASADGNWKVDLAALFPPEEAPMVADMIRGLSRHDSRRRRFLIKTFGLNISEIPTSDE